MAKKNKQPNTSASVTHIELPDSDALTLIEYFNNGMNATRAWMATHPNSQYNSARTSGAEWLAKPNIRAELKRFLSENAMSAEEALARLGDMARATVYPFIKYGDDGFAYFDLSHPEAKAHLHLIKEMETKRERRVEGSGDSAEEWEGEWVKVKLHDPQTALINILKMHGKFVDRVDVTSNGKTIKVTLTKQDE